jgi:Peptidase A4 family
MGHRTLVCLLVLGTLAVAPASALADTSDSTNWAGYAIQRPGVGFRTASASWTQPRPICRPGSKTYSSFWVGLGGFSDGSPALEQIGTEADCTRSGAVSSSAWWENVPAPSFNIFKTVRPGDQMAASVSVSGHTSTLVLRDLTRNWTFTKSQRINAVDVSSAEWIVEAPSDCVGNSCQTLPLANFGSTNFGSVGATTTRGHRGSLSDPRWQLSKINLRPSGRQFAVTGSLAAGATPSQLSAGGSAFGVNYQLVPLDLSGVARDVWVRARHVVKP